VEAVRSSVFDPLTAEQVARLREISETLVEALGGDAWPLDGPVPDEAGSAR
jgi:hypothetical protein